MHVSVRINQVGRGGCVLRSPPAPGPTHAHSSTCHVTRDFVYKALPLFSNNILKTSQSVRPVHASSLQRDKSRNTFYALHSFDTLQ